MLFKLLASVEAKGNSALEINYSYVDKNVAKSPNPYQYQIRSVDLDGSRKYSDIKSLNYLSPIVGFPFLVQIESRQFYSFL